MEYERIMYDSYVCSNYHNENPEIQIVSAIQSIYLTYVPATYHFTPPILTDPGGPNPSKLATFGLIEVNGYV